jgi:cell division protein FtsW
VRSSSKRQQPVDFQMTVLAATLLCFGLVMLYSSSAIIAEKDLGDPFFFLKRQTIWAFLGIGAAALASNISYQRLREWIWPLMLVTATLLIAVLFTDPIAGAKRWLRFGSVGLQPAEFAKITIVLFLADYLDRKRSRLSNLTQGLIVPWSVICILLLLIGLEPDLGTPALLFVIGTFVLFIGGTRPKHLITMVLCALPVLAFELLRLPYRRARLLNFLDPFADAQGTGFQLVQSILAVGSGGWVGKGLGASQLKLMYLPKPHTDFIFPIVCEELGLFGALIVLGLFTAFLLRGVRIARSAPDLFGTLLAAGLTLLITLQAFFNIAMAIGLMPTKGLPMPFFSYGGSSLLVTLTAVGILLNVSRHSTEQGPRSTGSIWKGVRPAPRRS